MIKDSEEKQETSTGASRSGGKGRGKPSLLPFDALMELAIHFEEGAEVHLPRNWEKGIPLSWYVDSAFRHLAAIMQGKTDESHERAFAWNAVCFLATWVRIKNGTLPAKLDDLPHRVASRSMTPSVAGEYDWSQHSARANPGMLADSAGMLADNDEQEAMDRSVIDAMKR